MLRKLEGSQLLTDNVRSFLPWMRWQLSERSNHIYSVTKKIVLYYFTSNQEKIRPYLRLVIVIHTSIKQITSKGTVLRFCYIVLLVFLIFSSVYFPALKYFIIKFEKQLFWNIVLIALNGIKTIIYTDSDYNLFYYSEIY